MYFNLKGREQHGIVASGEQSRAIIANLREQLLAWRDPVNGRHAVNAVSEVNPTTQSAAVAPDLIVDYSPGYRASWQTGLGETPAEEIEDNNDAWIGAHYINPADVPGVLFTSSRVNARNPKIPDVTASILKFYGVPQPSLASGHSFY